MAVREHCIKIAPQYLNAILDGSKKAELRKNDRGYRVGEVLSLVEFNQGSCTGREWAAIITHVLPVQDVMPAGDGWAVLSIQPCSPADALSYRYFGDAL